MKQQPYWNHHTYQLQYIVMCDSSTIAECELEGGIQ